MCIKLFRDQMKLEMQFLLQSWNFNHFCDFNSSTQIRLSLKSTCKVKINLGYLHYFDTDNLNNKITKLLVF